MFKNHYRIEEKSLHSYQMIKDMNYKILKKIKSKALDE